MRLVLASASPRRAELLRAAGFVFETLRVDLD
jgi:predicted house-cleaning NTP pyrophosphatase (Maf/HAM1 superfamily)